MACERRRDWKALPLFTGAYVLLNAHVSSIKCMRVRWREREREREREKVGEGGRKPNWQFSVSK